MECYNHESLNAVGLCKSCYKAICKECAKELEHGLACSEICESDVTETNEMNERGKKLYGIGHRKSKMPSSGVIIWAILSLLLWAVVLINFFLNNHTDIVTAVFATGFTLLAVFAHFSSKRTGLQC